MTRKTPVRERSYSQAEKRERNQKLYAMHVAQPDLSLKELGQRFGGISKQRVQQVLNQMKERT